MSRASPPQSGSAGGSRNNAAVSGTGRSAWATRHNPCSSVADGRSNLSTGGARATRRAAGTRLRRRISRPRQADACAEPRKGDDEQQQQSRAAAAGAGPGGADCNRPSLGTRHNVPPAHLHGHPSASRDSTWFSFPDYGEKCSASGGRAGAAYHCSRGTTFACAGSST